MGMPGYSGLVPNTMLAMGLVLNRDLMLSGQVNLELGKPTVRAGAWDAAQRDPIANLQSNVRVALAELELVRKVAMSVPDTHPVLSGPTKIISLPQLGKDHFVRGQLALVMSYADLRAERVNEIVSQVVPQTAYWAAMAALLPERHRYTWELLGAGLRFVMLMVMDFKRRLNVPRPHELSPLVQPILLTPGYSAFPSGHASEAYFAAELLSILAAGDRVDDATITLETDAKSLCGQLHRLAFRIAENRVVAGLHYPIDSVAGQWLGVALARWFVSRAGGVKVVPPLGALTFPVKPEQRLELELDGRPPASGDDPVAPEDDNAVLNWLWRRARAEHGKTP